MSHPSRPKDPYPLNVPDQDFPLTSGVMWGIIGTLLAALSAVVWFSSWLI